MIFQEIINVFEEIQQTYNTEEFDFTKTHTLPLYFIEGAGIGAVTDFETFINCNVYLDMLKIEFHLQRLIVMSESLVVAVVLWNFFNSKNEIGLVHEVGYVLQKKDSIWKVNVVLSPSWKDPAEVRDDMKNIRFTV